MVPPGTADDRMPRPIGRGSYKVAYRALLLPTALRRRPCVVLVPNNPVAADPLFIAEAEKMLRLCNHPHLVRCYG